MEVGSWKLEVKEKKILFFFLTAIFQLLTSNFTLFGEADQKPMAVLLLAHGGSARWDRQVAHVKKALIKAGYPTEIALGMADVANIERGLAKLQAQKSKQVICIPLMVGSNSELYEQFAYVLGQRDQPSADFLEGMRSPRQEIVKR